MKRLILSTLLLVACALGATAQNELYIYQHSGVTDTLQLTDVAGIRHLRTGLDGRQHDDYVVMSVAMQDETVRSYLLADLDSVVMTRDGARIRLTRFVGGVKAEGEGRRSPRRTSLDGDFMASASTVDFYWEDGDNIYIQPGETVMTADSVFIRTAKETAEFYFKGGSISGEEVTVYYPGQAPPTTDGRKVRISKNQSQALPNSTVHIGSSGDCGTAVATRQGNGSYYFDLDHQAAYLCFLPYIGNNLGRTRLKKITVRSDKAIAGVFDLATSGLTLDSDPSHTITLTTGGEDGFTLPQTPGQANAAYMVTAPQAGATRLTCEFTVYDTVLESEGVYTKIVDLVEMARNQVYVIKANCNNYVVDLGLPVKFLNHNYGAFAPEELGSYYAFGETSEKASYTSDNYQHKSGTPGRDIRLTNYDVAHVKLGGGFSMPTRAEWQMLVDSCETWTWTTLNGRNGYKVTGKNGNHLFLPAAGSRRGSSASENASRGLYRTSTMLENGERRAFYFNMKSDVHEIKIDDELWNGQSVRPVVSTGVQMTDGTVVQVMTDSAQCRFQTQQATLFGTLNGYGKAKAKAALEVGFLVGTAAQVADGKGTMVTATVTGDGRYSAVFNMPKDTAYCYRAYVRELDGSITLANTLQFGRAYADLGLPSGNLWSSISIGCVSPEEQGNYYAWGETTIKATYTQANHRWFDGHIYTFPDGCLRDIQATKYDVAAVEWGGSWVTPNKADLQELLDNCAVAEASVGGVPGWRLTSKVAGYTDRSIFMPKTGWRRAALNDYRKSGYFMSSELSESRNDYAYELNGNTLDGGLLHSDAIPVRPVNKRNATSASGRRLWLRTLLAGKRYNGIDDETDTLKAVVRGYTADGTTVGIVWWPQDGTRATGTVVALTPDADGYIRTVITGLTPGETYYYSAYADNGTTTAYGETCHIDAVGLVDLGLSVKWANVNIGAVNAEDGGAFYEWGATAPYNNTAQQYTANKDITPNSGHDIATNNWGGNFRMPTKTEWEELTNTDNCDWTWDTDRKGFTVTSKIEGHEGSHIFIPAPGVYDWQYSYHTHYGTWAYYWASTVENTNNAWRMWFNSADGARTVNSNYKQQGFSTRAVQSLDDEVLTIGMRRNVNETEEVDTLVSFVTLLSGRNMESGFILGETAELTAETTGAQILALASPVAGENKYAVTGLSAATTYYYRAYIKDGDVYSYGDVKRFQPMALIDLGLPSGTLWASINTGAATVEDFGDYYAWGETKPKDIYNLSTYEFYQNSTWIEIGDDIGGSRYDAATVNMGPRWRMPTMAQCTELVQNTTAEAITLNGVNCWRLTSTVNGRQIIFPRNSQMKEGTVVNNNAGSGVYSTSSRRQAGSMFNMYMPNSGPSANPSSNYDEMYWGKNIRAVVQVGTDLGGGVYAHVGTDGCDWTIGAATATLSGHATLSAAVSGEVSRGFVVGTIKEVETTTPAPANIVTISGAASSFTYDYPYTGGARYFRSFLKVGSQYYFGAVKAVTAADILDVEFNADAQAFDGTFSRVPIEKSGSSTCPYNDEYKRWEADMSANNAASTASNFYRCNYGLYGDFSQKVLSGHTIEALVKPMAVTPGQQDFVANYENGGEGIGIYQNQFYYCAYLGGGYRYYYAGTPVAGQYYHLVLAWDQENQQIRFYVNGELVSTATDVPQNMDAPDANIRYYVVGGQPAGSSGATEAWQGSVGFVRFYDKPLTSDDVTYLYGHLKD